MTKVGSSYGADLFYKHLPRFYRKGVADVTKLFCYILKSLADLSLDLIAELNVVSQESFDCLASLGELAFTIAEP